MKLAVLFCLLSAGFIRPACGDDGLEPAPLPRFHLTARPWKPLDITPAAYLEAVEGLCRFTAAHQDRSGAIIDPFLHREHQYATPYFGVAVGILMRAGRARDLWPCGVLAMDHACADFARGDAQIPDRHGEFFDAALAGGLKDYVGQVSEEKMKVWRKNLSTPRNQIVAGPLNNWRTYGMRGEWLRSEAGLVDKRETLAFISDSWLHGTQRNRVRQDRWSLYHDGGTDPESFAVESVARANLLGLIDAGYDGPEEREIEFQVERASAVALLLQDPSGQAPPNGRAADHVWNDVVYQATFDAMAKRAHQAENDYLAGQYRRAAALSFLSSSRWRRNDAGWAGSYYVTKNRFDPARRVGYQDASNYANYNGAVMLHLALAYLAHRQYIPERPAPVEIGGYALETDPAFSTVVANAGGMQILAAWRGDTNLVYGHYWTALGVERLGRVNWDTRLGPADGIRDAKTKSGVTFAPTWFEGGRWIRMADVPERYEGHFTVQFVHPLLVRCAIDYRPRPGNSGPEFRHEFVLTPDGVLATLRASGAGELGVTWPLLENDGAPLLVSVNGRSATTSYIAGGDQECLLSLGEPGPAPVQEDPVLSSFGWLRPIRVGAGEGVSRCFIYPRGGVDPEPEAVQASFHLTRDGFHSMLGRVDGTLYAGRTCAGGVGTSIECEGDNQPEATFEVACAFILQLKDGKIIAAEADRKTDVRIHGRRFKLEPYRPIPID